MFVILLHPMKSPTWWMSKVVEICKGSRLRQGTHVTASFERRCRRETAWPVTLPGSGIAMVRLQWVVHGVRTMLNSPLRSEFTGAETYYPKVEILSKVSRGPESDCVYSVSSKTAPNKRTKRSLGDSSGGYMGSRPLAGFHLDSTILMAVRVHMLLRITHLGPPGIIATPSRVGES